MQENIKVNDKLSINALQVADTDLCLNKMSHLTYEFKRKSYFVILLLCYNL